MGAISRKDSKAKTFILALLGIFSIAVAGDCGNGTGTDSGFGAGGENVEITGVISSSVEAPDGLAQTTGGGVTCTNENFLCELMVSDPEGAVLASEQVIVSLQTCGGRPVSGQTYSLGTVQVDPDSVPQGFNISSNCLPVDANIIDDFFNGFEGEVDVALGPDGLASVVITHRNFLDFFTSQEAIDLASLIGCPTLFGIQLLLAVSCDEGTTSPNPPIKSSAPPPPVPPSRSLEFKNQAKPPPSEESFFCDILPTIIQGALESSFCVDCDFDCQEGDTCEFEGFTCSSKDGCCTCPAKCDNSGNCGPGSHCAEDKGNCCICDTPCSKAPCPSGSTCNKSGCCVPSAGGCGDGDIDPGEQCDPPTPSGVQSKQCPFGQPPQNCSKSCQCEIGSGGLCGNGTFDGKEVCDPPGKQSGKCDSPNVYCGFDCTSCDICGDGTIEETEICDPPGSATGKCGKSSCGADCRSCDSPSCAGPPFTPCAIDSHCKNGATCDSKSCECSAQCGGTLDTPCGYATALLPDGCTSMTTVCDSDSGCCVCDDTCNNPAPYCVDIRPEFFDDIGDPSCGGIGIPDTGECDPGNPCAADCSKNKACDAKDPCGDGICQNTIGECKGCSIDCTGDPQCPPAK